MKAIQMYEKGVKVLNLFQSPFLLLIRIYIGYQCIISGWAHLHHIQQTTDFFTELHIPMPKANVIMSASSEMIFGAMLLVGLVSRISSLILVGNFVVAMLSVQLKAHDFSLGKLASDIWDTQNPILQDTAFPFLATALIVLIFGPGIFSIDAIVNYVRGKKAPAAKSS